MSIDSDLIRGHVDTIILKTLTTGDKYGYEIIKEINEKSNGTYELKQPTLYSCLKRLESQGLISAYWKNSDIGGRRHYYKLTKKGRDNYEGNIAEWFASRNIIDSLMGSHTTTSPLEDEKQIPEKNQPDESLEDVTKELQPILVETIDDTNDADITGKDTAQLVLDEDSSITQVVSPIEVDPRDFEVTSLDDADSEFLEKYYQTDENQINFLDQTTKAGNEDLVENLLAEENNEDNDINSTEPSPINYFSSTLLASSSDEEDEDKIETTPFFSFTDKPKDNENDLLGELEKDFEEEPEDDTEDSNKAMLDAFFHKYEGADVNKYKQNLKGAYYDKIKDDSSAKYPSFSEEEDDNSYNYEYDFSKQDDQESSPLSIFGSSEDDTNYSEQSTEDDNTTNYYETKSYSSPLNFGSNFDREDDDDLDVPHSFLDIDHSSYENNEETDDDTTKITSFTSSFGKEYDEDTKSDYLDLDDEDESQNTDLELFEDAFSEPVIYSRQTNTLSAAARPAFTELDHKAKLNHLSSYATTQNFDVKIDTKSQESHKDYEELKEEFSDLGIMVRTYSKPEKEPKEAKNYLLVNKIKFVSSWINYGVILLLLALTYLIASSIGYTNLSETAHSLSPIMQFVVAALIMLAFPGFYTIMYFINKTKKVKPNYSALISIIFALLFFIVCINIIYLVNILMGFTKFTQTDYNHLLWLLPSVCALFIIIQSLVYTILYKTKRFLA